MPLAWTCWDSWWGWGWFCPPCLVPEMAALGASPVAPDSGAMGWRCSQGQAAMGALFLCCNPRAESSQQLCSLLRGGSKLRKSVGEPGVPWELSGVGTQQGTWRAGLTCPQVLLPPVLATGRGAVTLGCDPGLRPWAVTLSCDPGL